MYLPVTPSFSALLCLTASKASQLPELKHCLLKAKDLCTADISPSQFSTLLIGMIQHTRLSKTVKIHNQQFLLQGFYKEKKTKNSFQVIKNFFFNKKNQIAFSFSLILFHSLIQSSSNSM